MKKKKLKIKSLKLKSFVTELGKEQQNNTKGGFIRKRSNWNSITVRGTRFTEVSTRDGLVDGIDL